MIIRILTILAILYLIALIVSFIFVKVIPVLIGVGLICALYLTIYKKFK